MEPTPFGVLLMCSVPAPCSQQSDFRTRIDLGVTSHEVTFTFSGIKDGEALFRATALDLQPNPNPASPVPLLGLSTHWPEGSGSLA